MLEYIKFMVAASDDGGRRTEERGCNFNVGKGGRERERGKQKIRHRKGRILR